MSKPKAKTVWANAVNLSGVYSKQPVQMHGITDRDSKSAYRDASGDFHLKKLGTTTTDGLIQFAASDKAVVAAWTDGVLAVISLLREWAKMSLLKQWAK